MSYLQKTTILLEIVFVKISVARRGIEPVTFALLARRSNQLS